MLKEDRSIRVKGSKPNTAVAGIEPLTLESAVQTTRLQRESYSMYTKNFKSRDKKALQS